MKILLLLLLPCFPICWALKGVVNMEIIHQKCFHRSVAPIIRCQLTFQNNVKQSIGKRPFYVNISEVNEEQLKTVCCGLWDMTSCMKGAAVKWSNCEPNIITAFSKDIDQIASNQEFDECHKHYSEGSIKCGFPMWATITLVVIGIIVLTSVTCVLRRFCRRTT